MRGGTRSIVSVIGWFGTALIIISDVNKIVAIVAARGSLSGPWHRGSIDGNAGNSTSRFFVVRSDYVHHWAGLRLD